MWSNRDSPPGPNLTHGLIGFIHQPQPRGPSPVFEFAENPAPNARHSLPTPSNTPPPRVKDPDLRLTIDHISECEAQFAGSDSLGRALDALPSRSAGYNLVRLNREEPGEFILSARSFGHGEIHDACRQAWSRLDERTLPAEETTKPPRIADVAPTPSAQAYLTPPSSPETVCKLAKVSLADIDDLSLNAESTLIDDSLNGSIKSPDAKCTSNIYELEDTSYDGKYSDMDWAEDSSVWSEDDEDRGEDSEFETLYSPMSGSPAVCPSRDTNFPTPRDLATSPDNLTDLTTVLDLSSFPEWPVARGGFGDVWRGDINYRDPGRVSSFKLSEEERKTGLRRRVVAVKRLTTYTSDGEEGATKVAKRTAREVYIWSRLHHRNVLPLLGICSFRGGMGIVSPWQESGNATTWVNRNPGADRLKLCEGICAGLVYLHNNDVIHGDLRGANVLISPGGIPRLIDFGLASIVGGVSAFSASSTMAGTVRWMAPELQVGESNRTTVASDVFALGMTILEIHTGAAPFANVTNDIAILLKYQRGERPLRPDPAKNIHSSSKNTKHEQALGICVPMSDALWHLVQDCWDQDANARPCTVDVLRRLLRQRRRPR